MSTERCRQLNEDFCRRYLPAQAPNAHSLLLDWDGLIVFTPQTEQVQRCLTDYASLVEESTAADPCDILNIGEGSELALVYLYRGLESQPTLPDPAGQRRLSGKLRQILRASAEWFGPQRWESEMRWYDGFKAPAALASLLDTLHESGTFCQRFLPAGVPNAQTLLSEAQSDNEFTPSACELQQCLDAYTNLLRTATRINCLPVRWCVDATEITLAYLSRALRANVPLPERATSQGLAAMIRHTLNDAITLFGAMRWYDGFKRIDILAWLLEENTPHGLQGWHVFRSRLRQLLRVG
jgi:hypothetical protein